MWYKMTLKSGIDDTQVLTIAGIINLCFDFLEHLQ